MKVKVFAIADTSHLPRNTITSDYEGRVNEWLEQNPTVSVCWVLQSQSLSTCVVAIYYEERR